MIRVINLSPAIDITYAIDKLTPGQSHRVQSVHRSPGGKGVNVARIIQRSGAAVELVLPLGGESGDWIADQLTKVSLNLRTVRINEETRSCLAVVDKHATVFNEPAAQLTEGEFAEILAVLKSPVRTTVISGSLPSELSQEQVSSLFEMARHSSEQLIVDTSGPALLLAAKAGADLLKPNLEEALSATGTAEATAAVFQLLALGAKSVLLSLGENGLCLYAQTKLSALAKPVTGNATGAGDAVTAAAAIGMTEDQAPRQWLVAAAAAGLLAVHEPTAGVIDWEKHPRAMQQIQITEEKWPL